MSVSCSVGVRLPGGRQKITLVMKTGSCGVSPWRDRPIACEHAVEELARAADEGLALNILIAARRFADAA